LIVDDVSTLYRRRGESLPRLVRLVEDLTTAHPGRYLLAFPSYEYLESFRDAFDARGDTTPLLCQQRDMDLDARASYLRKISETRVITACIVLGGVFSESVDFSNASLDGVVVVGVGLPPPELVRRSMQRYFDEKGSDGRGIAFVQPAMSKVLQVAGRLLRSPDDLGVLCLVDARFAQRDYARFFPEHWQAVRVGHLEVAEKVAKFWRGRILTASAASTP
jgi:Rad3-related DNA helicase